MTLVLCGSSSVARYKQLGDEDSKRRALMIAHILMEDLMQTETTFKPGTNWETR